MSGGPDQTKKNLKLASHLQCILSNTNVLVLLFRYFHVHIQIKRYKKNFGILLVL